MDNLQIVKEVYRLFGEKNIPVLLSHFDKDIEFVRPGNADIPFAGTFKGFDGLIKMFTIISQSIRLKKFIPERFFVNEDMVVVLGFDTAEVIATGRSYTSTWVQAFTLKDSKIIHVQAYVDTLTIAHAFHP
ncbi:MAG TPA: nuclear transport factor 2 family protein [Chitinophagaceae bacterium]|jgi:ketosteroid isomerase-like protein|nr:nuclear transport factor 2 family protein [Chitinophagaceae bacterium]